jgi:hypothetical protein
VGTVGQSTFKVIDHEYIHSNGSAACSQLQSAHV